MPLETSQRYGMNNSDNKELEEEKIKTKIIKKIRHLFLKLKEWVYD